MIERFRQSDALGGLLAVPPQSAFHCVNLGEGDAISSISTLTEMPLWENGGYFDVPPRDLRPHPSRTATSSATCARRSPRRAA